jgi:hypothetical protein
VTSQPSAVVEPPTAPVQFEAALLEDMTLPPWSAPSSS